MKFRLSKDDLPFFKDGLNIYIRSLKGLDLNELIKGLSSVYQP